MKTLKIFACFILQFSLFLRNSFGTYEVIPDRIENYLGEKDEIYDTSSTRITKLNRSCYVMTGDLILKQTFDSNITVAFKAFNEAGGQYKYIFGRVLGKFCDVLYEDHIKEEVTEFFHHTNYTDWEWGKCPIPSGTYNIKNYVPRNGGDYLPPYIPMPGGEKWKVILYYMRDNVELGGFVGYGRLRNNETLIRYGGK